MRPGVERLYKLETRSVEYSLASAFVLLRAVQLLCHGTLVQSHVPRVALAPEVAPDLGLR